VAGLGRLTSPVHPNADRSFWKNRRVLVTGHTGFKGAWLVLWLDYLGANVTGMALPPEDPAGAFETMSPWPGLLSHLADVRDEAQVDAVMRAADPEVVIHLAAQSLVRRGHTDPVGTYATNVLGTAHLLRAASRAPSLLALVVVTSDKVYANDGGGRRYREGDPLGGADPYSSSKACAELVVSAWRRGVGDGTLAPTATARAGNVIGGGDVGQDRLLPDTWRALVNDRPVRLRYPRATRPWQFVLEPLLGYLLVAERLAITPDQVPPAVNLGPDPGESCPVAEVVGRVLSLWGSGRWELEAGAHLPEAPALHLDSTLAGTALGWSGRLDLDAALRWTVEWWRRQAQGGDLRRLALTQIRDYEALSSV
jgi:CDP-glucose 4,6-dehydratase